MPKRPQVAVQRSGGVRVLGPLALCLLLSGAGSLALETVWLRRLELVFGVTTLAVSTVLAAYMLGLGLGGLLGGRIAARIVRGARAYGGIELGIGAAALVVPWLLSALPAAQRAVLALPFWGAALARFVLALVVLVTPTLLMGATLPILVVTARRLSPATRDPAGLLYGVNTLGAVAGVAFTTFLALPRWGLTSSNWFAAALDAVAGVIALAALAPREQRQRAAARLSWRELLGGGAPIPGPGRALIASYALVGFISLSCEVAWTRTLSLSFGSSVYAFATMLAAFLLGIALGSLSGRRWALLQRDPRVVYAAGVALLAGASWATFLLLQRTPDAALWFFERYGAAPETLTRVTLLLSLGAMLLPTLILGALFPVLVRAVTGSGVDEGLAVGALYFTNTIGSATGAFLTGFLLIPALGLARTMGAIAAVALVGAAVAAGLARLRVVAWVFAAAALLALLIPPSWNQGALTRGVFYRPYEYIDFGIPLLPLEGRPAPEILYYRDGVSATVSVHRDGDALDLRVDGKPDASLADMPTQSMLGHLPMALTPDAERVAVVGLASGVTAGTALLYGPQRLDVIDIEPAMVDASHFFDDFNLRPLASPKVRLIVDDGRHYLAQSRGSYDVIISEPSNPVVAGCANLFTREFFAAARGALRPGGRLMQWLQLYGMDEQTVASVLASLTSEFRFVYGFVYSRGWNDLLLLATDRELTWAELSRFDSLPQAARADLQRVNVLNWADLAAQLRLTPADLAAWAGRAERANTDDSMFVELRAPWLIRRGGEDFVRAVDAAAGAVWALPAGAGPPMDSTRLADLAWSNIALRGDLQQATRVIREALKGGGAPRAWAVAGLLFTIQKPDAPDGPRLLDAAVRAAPDDRIVRSAQARALFRRQRDDEALEHAEAAVAAAPGDPREIRLRQQVLAKLGRNAEALRDAEVGVAAPHARFEKTIWEDAGFLAARVGRWDLAAQRLERYVALEPHAVEAWKILAQAYTALNRTADAARASRNALIAAEDQLRLTHRRARRIARFESKESAINLLRELTRAHPEYAPAAEDLRKLERGETP